MGRHVGVDIGTSSIRVTYDSQTNELPIVTHRGRFITQSSVSIYHSLLQLLPSHYNSIAISATCSTVVTKKINNHHLEPFNIEGNESDILLWMDHSAQQETEFLNNSSATRISQARRQLGGKFVAELGLPKLKMIQNVFGDNDLVCFELYDWISYLLKFGPSDGRVEYHPLVEDNTTLHAIDGSIKGWSKELLDEAGIIIEIGGLGVSGKIVPRLGEPVGTVHGTRAVIGHGCIDCYAGWLNSYSSFQSGDETDAKSCFMVAGTSTCFIYRGQQQKKNYSGVWGPYQLAKDNEWLYEFGQPATGKLYERLFEKHGKKDYVATTFKQLETGMETYISQNGKGIHELLKGYFYYGDVYGNRTPYQDGNMAEMIIDNPNGPFGPIISTTTHASLLAEYILIMEFLAFQTRELIEPLGIESLTISGSQSKNKRFLHLLADVCNVSVKVASAADGCQGAAKMGHIAELCQQGYNYDDALDEVTKDNSSIKLVLPDTGDSNYSVSANESSLLGVKYEIYLDMADRQRQYRDMIG